MISYSFHAEAESELDAAMLFYESRVAGLGRYFLQEIERTILFIREFPDAGAPNNSKCKRAQVDRFPYSIVYWRELDSVFILAVAHQKRRPGYWRQRS